MRLISNQQEFPTAKVRDTYHMYSTVPLYVQFNTCLKNNTYVCKNHFFFSSEICILLTFQGKQK